MVSNAQNALYEVKKKLFDCFKITIKKEWWIDYNRKAIIQTTTNTKFFVLFKRDFFHTYGRLKGTSEEGESINIQDYEYAVYELEITEFLYIYQNNSIYKIRAKEIEKNKIEYINETDHKEQYLFSANLLQKIC